MNPVDEIALFVLRDMLDDGSYAGVECLFARNPIIQCYDTNAQALRVIVIYADNTDKARAIQAARDVAAEVMSNPEVEGAYCWATVCGESLEWEEIDKETQLP